MSGLQQRAITALIFVAVMLAGLYGGRYAFATMFAVITGLSLWEFFSLTLSEQGEQRRGKLRKYFAVAFGLVPFAISTILHLNLFGFAENHLYLTSLSFLPVLFLAFTFELFAQSEKPFQNVAQIVLGMAYIGIPFAMLNLIAFNGAYFNTNIILGILLLTWANDTGAYLVGSKIGKTPLLPRISPKKTWEGTGGGIAVTFLAALALSHFFKEIRWIDWVNLSGIVSVFGSVGDLVESMLKRSYDVKDSGNLLPGHGGFLDRFDAFIFIIPFATTYLMWIRWATTFTP